MEEALLLGNDRLKDYVHTAVQSGRISHFYLISGPRGSGKHTLARYLSAAILCTGRSKPCMACNACRKVLNGSHPDVITVDDPDKKTVTVDMARETRADMFVMPNESEHKIYCFPRADDININAQNALLKVLEEPPAYGVFMLLAENPGRLLPTIRSRAVELRMQNLSAELLKPWLKRRFPEADEAALQAAFARSGGIAGQAAEFLEEGTASDPRIDAWTDAVCADDAYAMLNVMVPLERVGRNDLSRLLEQWLSLTEEALAGHYGAPVISSNARRLAERKSSQWLMDAVNTLKRMRLYCDGNVSGAAICAFLGKELTS